MCIILKGVIILTDTMELEDSSINQHFQNSPSHTSITYSGIKSDLKDIKNVLNVINELHMGSATTLDAVQRLAGLKTRVATEAITLIELNLLEFASFTLISMLLAMEKLK